MKKIINKQIGEILLDSKLITTEQLEEALRVQKEKGGLIGHVLITLGYASEEAIAKALMTQYGIPFLSLENYEIDLEVVKLIPEQVARQYGLIAVDRVGEILTVVMSNPLNSQAIEDIEMVTKKTPHIFISTISDVTNAINQFYKKLAVSAGGPKAKAA